MLASIVKSDAADDALATDTSDGLRLSPKGMASDENVRGKEPPRSSSDSAISRPFDGTCGAEGIMIEDEVG